MTASRTRRFLLALTGASLAFAAIANLDPARATDPQGGDTPRPHRFAVLDVFIDPAGTPLAAYQFRLVDPRKGLQIVGIEGGEHPAFAEPPYYDPRALNQNRVIVAAFQPDGELPRISTRVATLHVRIPEGDPLSYEIELELAATENGARVPATIRFEQRESR